MSDLTTLANVKQYLGITNTGDDALLTSLVSRVSQNVQTWLGRSILSASYTEIYDGSGGYVLVPKNYPITAIASLSIDTIVVPLAPDSTQPGYMWNADKIVLVNGYRFTRNLQNVVVSYTAGYAATPMDLEEAVIELIGFIYKGRDRIGLASKGLAGEQTNFITKDMPETVRTVLNQYKRYIPI
jgi:hypothetical protein